METRGFFTRQEFQQLPSHIKSPRSVLCASFAGPELFVLHRDGRVRKYLVDTDLEYIGVVANSRPDQLASAVSGGTILINKNTVLYDGTLKVLHRGKWECVKLINKTHVLIKSREDKYDIYCLDKENSISVDCGFAIDERYQNLVACPTVVGVVSKNASYGNDKFRFESIWGWKSESFLPLSTGDFDTIVDGLFVRTTAGEFLCYDRTGNVQSFGLDGKVQWIDERTCVSVRRVVYILGGRLYSCDLHQDTITIGNDSQDQKAYLLAHDGSVFVNPGVRPLDIYSVASDGLPLPPPSAVFMPRGKIVGYSELSNGIMEDRKDEFDRTYYISMLNANGTDGSVFVVIRFYGEGIQPVISLYDYLPPNIRSNDKTIIFNGSLMKSSSF